MRISSGAKISKGTLKTSVKAIKGQDVLRGFSKDSSDRGVYVSLSYAPGSGKPQTNAERNGQFIYVTIHNIPRFNGKAEAIQVRPFANLYYRIEPNGKIYKHVSGYGEFGPDPDDTDNYYSAARDYPSFILEPRSLRSPNFLRPWVEVNDEGEHFLDYNRGEASPRKYDGLFHPKMVAIEWEEALAGTGPYMTGYQYINSSLEYKWVANGDYINVTYPMGIHQSLLPDKGVVGLTDINILVAYKEFYNGEIQNPGSVVFFDNSFNFSVASVFTSLTAAHPVENCVHFKRGGQQYFSVYGQSNISAQAEVRGRGGYKEAGYNDPLASANELPLYGDADYALRPAQRKYYPFARGGKSLADSTILNYSTLNFYHSGPIPWPELSRPKLILSEDGTKVQKATIGSWWSQDPNYGKNIGYRCEWQRNYEDLGWRTFITQNEGFLKSNIKSEDLQPVTEDIGTINLKELDQDYLKYYFQAYNDGFDIQEESSKGVWNGIRVKISAKLELNGITHYGHMLSNEVSMPKSSALGYYYYGGEGFEGIGVSNL